MGSVTAASTVLPPRPVEQPPQSLPVPPQQQPQPPAPVQPALNNNSSSQSSADKSNTSLKQAKTAVVEASSSEDLDELDLSLQATTTASEWTPEELLVLENALARYPADKYPPVERYIHVAASLPNKTARDVALRVKIAQQEKRKGLGEDANKRKAVAPPAPRVAQQAVTSSQPPGAPPAAAAVVPAAQAPALPAAKGGTSAPPPVQAAQAAAPAAGDGGGASATGAGAPGGSGGVDGGGGGNIPVALTQLMEQNYHILSQFKSNMAQFKVVENTDLLIRYRDNLVSIQQNLANIGGMMATMPPLPVQPNLELAGKFLPAKGGVSPMMPMMPFAFGGGASMGGAGLMPGLQMDFFGAAGGMQLGAGMSASMMGMGMPGMMPGGMAGMMAPGGMMPGMQSMSMGGMQDMPMPGLMPMHGQAMPLPMQQPQQLQGAASALPPPSGTMAAAAAAAASMSRQGSAVLPAAIKTEP